ncbi:hypothetical protein JCM21142_93316 [Saccharicrinis fermentans DSM 9555 = JCM 21142]|uniref:Uncharacterized protein n=1 Tax=Saccharicrinis fermentans DSM 9555 = JCM 21142 TaxID=869213 RepID=W7YQC2_9BACT|nr:hypothetical protein JCM21142_93316 [Saccharicrinis fermentans DSM 9555 = JCM 21142]
MFNFVYASYLAIFLSLKRRRQRQGFRLFETDEMNLTDACFKNENNAVFGNFLQRPF